MAKISIARPWLQSQQRLKIQAGVEVMEGVRKVGVVGAKADALVSVARIANVLMVRNIILNTN